MGIEDYFPFSASLDRKPLTISYEEVLEGGNKKYHLVLKDRDGIKVTGSCAMTAQEFNALLESKGDGEKKQLGLVERLILQRNYTFTNPDFKLPVSEPSA